MPSTTSYKPRAPTSPNYSPTGPHARDSGRPARFVIPSVGTITTSMADGRLMHSNSTLTGGVSLSAASQVLRALFALFIDTCLASCLEDCVVRQWTTKMERDRALECPSVIVSVLTAVVADKRNWPMPKYNLLIVRHSYWHMIQSHEAFSVAWFNRSFRCSRAAFEDLQTRVKKMGCVASATRGECRGRLDNPRSYRY